MYNISTSPNNTLRSRIRISWVTLLTLLVLIPVLAQGQVSRQQLLLLSGKKQSLAVAQVGNTVAPKTISATNEEVHTATLAADNNRMYWTQKQGNEIALYAALLQGENRIGTKKILASAGDISALTAAGNHVFWYNAGTHTLYSMQSDDSLSMESILDVAESEPVVGLYSTEKYLYYIQSVANGSQRALYRINHEGMHKTILHSGSPSDIRAVVAAKGLLMVIGERAVSAFTASGMAVTQAAVQFKGNISAAVQGEYLLISDDVGIYRLAISLQEKPELITQHSNGEHQQILASHAMKSLSTIATLMPVNNIVGEGKDLLLYGENIPAIRSITVGNMAVETFSRRSESEVSIQIPTGVKSNDIRINYQDGSEQVLSSVRVVKQPKIYSFMPKKVSAGTPVTIKGEHFTNVAEVFFGGMPAQEFTVISSTEIRAIAPTNGTGEITVQNAGGSDSKEGFILINPNLQIVRFQLEPVQLASMDDIQEKNSAIELTLKNNSAQTIRFRLQARISQTGVGIVFQSMIQKMPIMEIEPGETMVYTTNDFFRQGAIETPGSPQVQFPQGRYNVCVVVIDPVNPNDNLTDNICEEKNTFPRVDLSIVQQRITKILGYDVQLTDVEADFDNYYLSGRITNLYSNDMFSFAAGTQPVFQRVVVPIRNVPTNLSPNFNALPLNSSFRLQDSVLSLTVLGWIPAVIRQQGGITIEARPGVSNSGWIRSLPELNLTNLLNRTTGSSVTGRNILQLTPSVTTTLRSNVTPVSAPSYLGLYPSQWRPIYNGDSTRWMVEGKVMQSIQNFIYNRDFVRIEFKNAGSTLTLVMTPQGNTITSLPDVIVLNKDISMTLRGASTRQGNNTRYNEGEVTIPIKGSNTVMKLTVHEAVLNNLNQLVSARVSLPSISQVTLSGVTFVSNARDGVIAGTEGKYTIQINGTAKVRYKSLIAWDLSSRLTFTGNKDFTLNVISGIPSVKMKVITVAIDSISYQTSNQRLYVNGIVSLEVKAVEASGGNFVFGNNYFSVGLIGVKIIVPKKFEVGGYVGFDERTEIWSGGLELKVKKGTTEYGIAADFTRGPNSWSLALKLSKDPGILLFSKPTALIYVYLSQIRGNVAFDNDRWTVGIGGTITVQNSPIGGTPRLGFDIDGSIAWGAGEHTILTISGKTYGEYRKNNVEARLDLGQASISFNLNTGRITGTLNSNVNIFNLASFTATGNMLADFENDQYYFDIEGSLQILRLINKRGRFVLARKYSTTLTEGSASVQYPGNRIEILNGLPWVTRNDNLFSGIYFRVQDRLVSSSGGFNALIVSASYSTTVDVAVWGKATTDFSIAGGVSLNASSSISASLAYKIASVSGSASAAANINLGVRNGSFWFDGSLSINVEAYGKVGKSCGAGCNSINTCFIGAAGKICFSRSLNVWYNNRGSSGFGHSL